jgi:UDP-N-acetylmuramate--alanine ligase
MAITYSDSLDTIPAEIRNDPADSLIVYTPAIPRDSIQLNYFNGSGYEVYKRSEVLGQVTQDYFTIAVAGTHGKTTTSSMIAHTLHTSGRKLSAFLGGILQNYDTNLILTRQGAGEMTVVVEADEFDRSFLRLSPDIAVVTSADADHLDIYGSVEKMREAFGQFIERIRANGLLVIKKGIAEVLGDEIRPDIRIMEYNFVKSNIRAGNIRYDREELRFDFISPETTIENIPLSQPGRHNIENAVAAVAVCLACGISEGQVKQSFSTYRGVKRRFGLIFFHGRATWRRNSPRALRRPMRSYFWKFILPGSSRFRA